MRLQSKEKMATVGTPSLVKFGQWCINHMIQWKSDEEIYFAYSVYIRNHTVVNFFLYKCKVPLSANILLALYSGETDDGVLAKQLLATPNVRKHMFPSGSTSDLELLITRKHVQILTCVLDTWGELICSKTEIYYCITRGQLECAKIIAKKTSTFQSCIEQCLEFAIQHNRPEFVKWFMEENPYIINTEEQRRAWTTKASPEICDIILTEEDKKNLIPRSVQLQVVSKLSEIEKILTNLRDLLVV